MGVGRGAESGEREERLRRTYSRPRFSAEPVFVKGMSPIFFWGIDFMLSQILTVQMSS